MPRMTGLEMLQSLARPPRVILTTAYSEFALESYEHGIVDYLLKPIAFPRFLKAINKIIELAPQEIAAARVHEYDGGHVSARLPEYASALVLACLDVSSRMAEGKAR